MVGHIVGTMHSNIDTDHSKSSMISKRKSVLSKDKSNKKMILIKEINTCENMADLKLPVDIITKREDGVLVHNSAYKKHEPVLSVNDLNDQLINLSYDNIN